MQAEGREAEREGEEAARQVRILDMVMMRYLNDAASPKNYIMNTITEKVFDYLKQSHGAELRGMRAEAMAMPSASEQINFLTGALMGYSREYISQNAGLVAEFAHLAVHEVDWKEIARELMPEVRQRSTTNGKKSPQPSPLTDEQLAVVRRNLDYRIYDLQQDVDAHKKALADAEESGDWDRTRRAKRNLSSSKIVQDEIDKIREVLESLPQ